MLTKQLLRVIVATACIPLFMSTAHAEFIVDSPGIEKGEAGIQWLSSTGLDDHTSGRFGEQALYLYYAPTDGWYVVLEGFWQKPGGDGYSYATTAIENDFDLFTGEEYWLQSGLEVIYYFSHEQQTADSLYAILILEKEVENFTHTLNFGFGREIGEHRSNDTAGYLAWKSQYNYQSIINPGIEYYSNIADIGHAGRFSDQEHYLGATLSGEITEGIGYDVGLLFGVSDAASDNVIKLNLGYDFSL